METSRKICLIISVALTTLGCDPIAQNDAASCEVMKTLNSQGRLWDLSYEEQIQLRRDIYEDMERAHFTQPIDAELSPCRW